MYLGPARSFCNSGKEIPWGIPIKCKPSAHCACVVTLIDGLDEEYAFTRGFHASS